MTSRREFLILGAAAAALPATARNLLINPENLSVNQTGHALPLQVVFDGRIRESRAFADTAYRLGADTPLAIQGDIARHWYNDLLPGLQQTPQVLAGMTGPEFLFCLEILARDQRMHVVLLIEHLFGKNGNTHHLYTGTLPPQLIHELHEAGRQWSRAAARIVTDQAKQPSRSIASAYGERQLRTGNSPQTLVSWVMTPTHFS
jgi:hypothetical protein